VAVGISLHSGFSTADAWLSVLEPMVGLTATDERYAGLLYPHDTPVNRTGMARSQSGCALTWLAAARVLGVVAIELARPYHGRQSAVTDVEGVCKRYSALERVGGAVELHPGDMVRIGNDDVASGGSAHILTVRSVSGDVVESIDGGQLAMKDDPDGRWKAGAVITIVRRTLVTRGGRVWMVDSRGRAKRVETVGRCAQIEIAPPADEASV
jgi:hypothetical protein